MAREKKTPPPKVSSKFNKETIVKYYLLAYNIIAALGWAYILVALTTHLLCGTVSSDPAPVVTKATNTLTRYLSSIPYLKSSTLLAPSTPAQIESCLPPYLVPYFKRASTAYDKVGEQTAWVQTLAVLEIAHALLGLVRSSIETTVMQVFSRLVLVWGIAERYDVARTNPLYALMVFAWSLTEVIRYIFYATSLITKPPYLLVYLRYTTFYILYPLGAGSEAFLMYSTLPNSSPSPIPSWRSFIWGIWTVTDYVRGTLFLVWWPALYVLMAHMVNQRRKVLGNRSGQTLGSKKAQ
jgi:very-long-chain (3R)-3-hydroxyacyl-CoA dehydratase